MAESRSEEQLTKTPQNMRLYRQERTILAVTELICRTMKEQGLARAGLARRLNTTTHSIDEILDGRRKMDIRMIADIFTAMGREVRFQAVEIMCDAPATTTEVAFIDV